MTKTKTALAALSAAIVVLLGVLGVSVTTAKRMVSSSTAVGQLNRE